MTFEATWVADCLVDLFGALGTLVVAYDIRRSDPWGAISIRFRWALYIVAALFLLRCLAWGTGSIIALRLADNAAAAMPVAALVAAEGLIRRHAPRAMKLAILGMSSVAAVIEWLPGVPAEVDGLALLTAVAGGFGAVAYLLLTRDRTTLTDAENTRVRRVVIALMFLVPLIATDFRSLMPSMPVRLGAAEALAVLFFAFGPGSFGVTNLERTLTLVVFVATAALLAAFGYVAAGHGGEPGHFVRAGAVSFCGLIFAALFSELLGARAERRKAVDPLLDARSASEFVAALKQHTLIGNVHMLEGDEIAPLGHPRFFALLQSRPILKRAEAPWGLHKTDPGVERVVSLLMTSEATHVMRLSDTPLRLVVFQLPPTSIDPRMESELRVAQRLGQLLFDRPVPA